MDWKFASQSQHQLIHRKGVWNALDLKDHSNFQGKSNHSHGRTGDWQINNREGNPTVSFWQKQRAF